MGILINKPLKSRIEGVGIFPLKQIEDERGAVLHMLRSDSQAFTKFGELYFSIVNPGSIKAWKRHKEMTQRFAVPAGRIRLVLFDDRPGSQSRGKLEEIILGRPDRYYLVCIPPLIWYGFQGVSETPTLLVNCPDILHDPKEADNLSIVNDLIPFDWNSNG